MYDNYEDFVRVAVERFYEQVGKKNRASFIALLIASGETVATAYRSMSQLPSLVKVAGGVVGVVALRAGIKFALSGPLGWILSAAAVGSLIRYFFLHHRELMQQVQTMRQIIEETRVRYEEIKNNIIDGKYSEEEGRLMMDGLMQQLMRELTEVGES